MSMSIPPTSSTTCKCKRKFPSASASASIHLLISILLLLLSSSVVTGSDSGAGTGSSNHPSRTIEMPSFTFKMLIRDAASIDLHLLKASLNHATENHLAEHFQASLQEAGGSKRAYEGMHLASTIKNTHDNYAVENDEKARVSSDFTGQVLFDPTDSVARKINKEVLHLLVAQAMTGDAYWVLMHRLVEDDLLAKIDNLDIRIDTTDLDMERGAFDPSSSTGSKGAVAVLAIFTIILFGSTVFLTFLAYRRYRSSSEESKCCQQFFNQSKNSDSTEEDDTDLEDGFHDENDQKTANTNHRFSLPPSPKKSIRKQKTKPRRARPSTKASKDLDAIQEDEEEEDQEEMMAEIPLDSILI